MFEEFLNDIIAKDIRHELERIGKKLTKDLVFLIAIGRFKLLLYESRTMLVPTKLHDMIIYVLLKLATTQSFVGGTLALSS